MAKRGFAIIGLLAGVAPVAVHAQQAQPAAAPAQPGVQAIPESADEPEEVVVTGEQQRGAVKSDIPPEIQLNQADIRAYGVSSVADLLNELAPQTGSSRGRGGEAPVVLLNGRRISSFAEIRNLPTEAIERVDILPEEVSLKFGYSADQRVVNFVLRQRFRALTTELQDSVPTAGGNSSQQGSADILKINRDRRVNLDVQYQGNSALLESERDIRPTLSANGTTVDTRPYRTLVAPSQDLAINGSYARNLTDKIGATINTRVEMQQSQAWLGLPDGTTAVGNGTTPLQRDNGQLTAHVGATLNGDGLPLGKDWQWSLTGNYDRASTRTLTDTGAANVAPADRGRSTSNSGGVDGLIRGPLFNLPAGEVSTSIRVSASTSSFDSSSVHDFVTRSGHVARDIVSGQANLDVPITSRRKDVLSAIGDLTLNGNIAVQHLSDFGSLVTTGYGVNWSPLKPVRLIASWTQQEGPPSANQLGDPVLTTPNVRVFDYVRGTTVNVTTISGGNPLLSSDDRHVMKLGLELRPFEKTDFSFRADYVTSTIRNAISSLPAATAAVEAAFPDRFFRENGDLVSIDERAVNFASVDTQQLRWGFNLSVPLKSSLEKRIAAMRAQREAQRAEAARTGNPLPPEGSARNFGQGGSGQPAAPGQNQPPRSLFGGSLFGGQDRPAGGAPAPGGAAGPGGPGGPGGGGFRGGRGLTGPNGALAGRLQFSLYHTWYFKDQIKIRDGVPILDLLHGGASGSSGGQPAHQIDAQAGYFKDGLGVRLGMKWQSSTEVLGGTSTTGRLDFGSLATFNLRTFVDLGRQFKLVRAHHWLRGVRVSLAVNNLFDARQRVTDGTGQVPVSYQPDLLDPTGRSVMLSIRKLFL